MISCCRFDIRNGVGVVKDGGSVLGIFCMFNNSFVIFK